MPNQKINPGIKAFIFDVDGTLYQKSKLRKLLFTEIIKFFINNPIKGIEAIISILSFRYALEKIRSMNIVNEPIANEQLKMASAICFIKINKIRQHVTQWMEIEPLRFLKKVKYPYSDLFFNEAKKKGLKLAVWSDYPISNKIEALGLKNVFDIQLSSMDSDINKLKPNPAGIKIIVKRLCLKPEQVVYVGDRYDIDARTAYNAGVDCIIVGERNNDKVGYKYNVQSYLDLYNWMKKI